ncbi:MAG: VOC family protein [Anaerolineales bacterium]
MRFDHAIIAVSDLEVATADFEKLGFTVLFGGEHAGGLTHNALVTFADGTYLEVMAPTDPGLLREPSKPGPGNYLFLFDAGEGFAGLALHTNDLDAVVERVRRNGIEIADPAAGGRRRTDGVELAWRTAFPMGSVSPFFITDENPRELRVRTEPELTTHPNGAIGITQILSLVTNLEEGVARYSILLGEESTPGPDFEGAETAAFEVGSVEAAIAAPDHQEGLLAEHLVSRGEGPFQITIQSDQSGSIHSHGARIELIGK